jgi:hypothetical protein
MARQRPCTQGSRGGRMPTQGAAGRKDAVMPFPIAIERMHGPLPERVSRTSPPQWRAPVTLEVNT